MALTFKRVRVERIHVEILWNFKTNTTSGVQYSAIVASAYAPNNNLAPASLSQVLDN